MEKALVAGTSGPSVAFQLRISDSLAIPRYLEETYWWAYVHPNAVKFFDRHWIVNLILWGNMGRLRDAALAAIGPTLQGRTLQVACVYGNFTPCAVDRLAEGARMDVVDVTPIQLKNLSRKLKKDANVYLHHQDSTNLAFQDEEFDNVIVFFLLHEQPNDIKKKTISEAMRMVKPGGKLIFVDYHEPSYFNPFRYIMIPILRLLEPFAMDLWSRDVVSWVEETCVARGLGGLAKWSTGVHQETLFGGLYQKVVLERARPDVSSSR
ncbi:MAG: class I SAM-dependent methyltransferase [Magnetococcales bacterium]|nr:class I SAM-dependent methyltransferase [Magnetococcales bacterium]